MFAEHFLHLQRAVDGKIELNKEYDCKHPVYGHMGRVKAMLVYTNELDSLQSATLMMEGNMHWKAEAATKNTRKTDMIQVCVFSFIRRTDSAFQFMMRKEFSRIQISFTPQGQLF